MPISLTDAETDDPDLDCGEAIPISTPGDILKRDFLEPMEISAYRLAKAIHVPPNRIGEILRGHRAITADTALRLGRFFGMTSEFWMNLQTDYDLRTTKRDHGRMIADEVAPYHP